MKKLNKDSTPRLNKMGNTGGDDHRTTSVQETGRHTSDRQEIQHMLKNNPGEILKI